MIRTWEVVDFEEKGLLFFFFRERKLFPKLSSFPTSHHFSTEKEEEFLSEFLSPSQTPVSAPR